MLDADELYIIADRMVDILDELNRWAIVDIAERIIEMQNLHLDSLPGTVIWLKEVAEQCGIHYSTMLRKISQITDIASDELDRLFKDAAVDIYNNDVELYQDHDIDITKITDYESLSDMNKQIVQEMYKRTDKSMKNFTRTTANASQQLLMQQLDKVYTEVKFGYKSYDKAIADAIKEVSKETLTVTYASGYKDSIETNIRRAVLTSVNQTAGQMGVSNAIEMGCEYVIVSSHLGARISNENPIANHYGWQGQVYKIDGSNEKYKNLYEATGFDYSGKNSDPLGLFGYNCRHSIFPYWLGDSNPFKKYGKEENKEAYEKNKRKREFERKKRKLKTAVKAYDKAIENCKDIKTKMELQERKDIAKDILEQHLLETERGIQKKRNASNGNEKWDNSVNFDYINSQEYRNKFDKITDNQIVNQQIYKCAKAILSHRSNSDMEDMYMLDKTTGEILAKQVSAPKMLQVDYNDKMKKLINNNIEYSIITIHNHPTNYYPTGSDIASNGAYKYYLGIVVTHSGKIYLYNNRENKISAGLIDKRVEKYTSKMYNMSILDAQRRCLDEVKREYGISWWEV